MTAFVGGQRRCTSELDIPRRERCGVKLRRFMVRAHGGVFVRSGPMYLCPRCDARTVSQVTRSA